MSTDVLPAVSAKTLLGQLDQLIDAANYPPEFVQELRALIQQHSAHEVQRQRTLWGIYSVLNTHTIQDTIIVEAAHALGRALRA